MTTSPTPATRTKVLLVDDHDLIRKGLTLHGSWHYNLNLFPRVMQVIQRSPAVERLVSHVLPLRRIQEALELSAAGESAKILLKPWE